MSQKKALRKPRRAILLLHRTLDELVFAMVPRPLKPNRFCYLPARLEVETLSAFPFGILQREKEGRGLLGSSVGRRLSTRARSSEPRESDVHDAAGRRHCDTGRTRAQNGLQREAKLYLIANRSAHPSRHSTE